MAGGASDSYAVGSSPPPEASAYFRDKNLRPAFRWTEVWGQEHAYSFTVAKAVQLDVLAAIRDSLQRAIDEGRPYRAWASDLKPELQRLGWWGRADLPNPATGEVKEVQLGSPRRLRTIYDANLRTARAAGQWERAQRTKAVLPYFVYQLGPSIHHRPEHEAREGMVAPVDDPIWNSWYPPNGWGCKCWLQQITRSRADALGGPADLGDDDPDDGRHSREYRRRRDDGSVESIRVPKGIDPGWAGNPGKGRSATLMESLTEKLQSAGPEVAKAAIADLWRSPTAEVLPKLPGRFFAPVAVAPAPLKTALGPAAEVVMVSGRTIATKLADPNKQGSRPVLARDFARVQQILDQGVRVDRDRQAASYIAELDDGWWKVVVKRSGAGELIVSTLFPIASEKADRLLRRDTRAGGRRSPAAPKVR